VYDPRVSSGAGSTFTVLGGRGFLGSGLVRALRAQGRDVRAPGRDEAPWSGRPLGHVLYCVGYSVDYGRRPRATVEAHVCLLSRVLEEADFSSLVYLSSTRLYDSGGPVAHEDDDLVLDPRRPRHLYDLSKALGESLCHRAGRAGVRVARLSGVYSDDLETPGFLSETVRQAAVSRELELDTAPDVGRDYVHLDDVCAVLPELGRRGTRPVYNVASGVNLTNAELFDLLEEHAGCRVRASRPATGRVLPAVSIAALVEDLGVRPAPPQARLPAIIRGLRRVSDIA